MTKKNTELEASECSDLLYCKSCGGTPHITEVFCSGQYYECDCGLSAYRFPLPQTEGMAREIWNKLNAI